MAEGFHTCAHCGMSKPFAETGPDDFRVAAYRHVDQPQSEVRWRMLCRLCADGSLAVAMGFRNPELLARPSMAEGLAHYRAALRRRERRDASDPDPDPA